MSIRAYLDEDQQVIGLYSIVVEKKRDRAIQQENSIKFFNKKRASIKKKGNKKDILEKAKGRNCTSKLQSNIKTSIAMKSILEEKILDAKIEFILKKALNTAKRNFHKLIIDIIKRKKQMITEAIIIEALETWMT